jgi:hypothetical protein
MINKQPLVYKSISGTNLIAVTVLQRQKYYYINNTIQMIPIIFLYCPILIQYATNFYF